MSSLDLETVRNGRPWFDWQQWMDAMKLRGLKPAGSIRFSHYDQVIAAAISGSGVAMGKWPHLASQLRQEVLVAPLGAVGVARLGGYYIIVSGQAPQHITEKFLGWLRAEVKQDTKRRDKAAGKGRALVRRSGKRVGR